MPACEQVVYRREQLDCTIWAIEGPTEAPEDSETVEEAPEEARIAPVRYGRPSDGRTGRPGAPLAVVPHLRWPVSRRFLGLGASAGLALLAGIGCGGGPQRGPGGEEGERTEGEPEDRDRRRRRRGRGGGLRRLLRRLL
jgi:hypothetical protein